MKVIYSVILLCLLCAVTPAIAQTPMITQEQQDAINAEKKKLKEGKITYEEYQKKCDAIINPPKVEAPKALPDTSIAQQKNDTLNKSASNAKEEEDKARRQAENEAKAKALENAEKKKDPVEENRNFRESLTYDGYIFANTSDMEQYRKLSRNGRYRAEDYDEIFAKRKIRGKRALLTGLTLDAICFSSFVYIVANVNAGAGSALIFMASFGGGVAYSIAGICTLSSAPKYQRKSAEMKRLIEKGKKTT